MRLRSLSVTSLRVIEHAEIETGADLVVFAGANGSGKTSLLEALYILGTGRSFRARGIQDVVRRGAGRLLVRGGFEDAAGAASTVGVEKGTGSGARFRLSGEDVRSASSLARHLPLVLVTPESQRMLSDGAEVRRRLLDWLMFHVEPRYHEAHQRYRRALRQRNAMLRGERASSSERAAWSAEVGEAGEILGELRSRRLAEMLPVLSAQIEGLSSVAVTVGFEPGWEPGAGTLERQLHASWAADVSRGYTGLGPHRADLRFAVSGRPAQHVVSRGEGKVLTVAVLVGFARLLAAAIGRKPLILVDELASELDGENRARFMRALRATGAQTFVTTVSESLVDADGWSGVDVFRIEAGKAMKMLQ